MNDELAVGSAGHEVAKMNQSIRHQSNYFFRMIFAILVCAFIAAASSFGFHRTAASLDLIPRTPTLGSSAATLPGPLVLPSSVNTIGAYDPAQGIFYLRNANSSGSADLVFSYGPGGLGWKPIVGDWNGDGTDTIGAYDPAQGIFYLRNANNQGSADLVFSYGPGGLGWLPIVGDWNGDGTDTAGLYDPAQGIFYLRNTNSQGSADLVFSYGPGGLGWKPIVGDWNGDGTDTAGLYDPVMGIFYLRNANSQGNADLVFSYGPGEAGWQPIVGDWNGDGTDTAGLYDPAQGIFYLRNTNSQGSADLVFSYGPGGLGWIPLTGKWVSGPPPEGNISVARVDPANRTGGVGEDPLSRNFNWSVPLVSLAGRSGLDLGLSLSYNSLVWTQSGSTISFDEDRGFPGPGFRLGFPVIQSIYFNSEVGKNAYLLITPNGERVELRQVGASTLYEAADSSHLLLNSATMILRTTDGTQLSYEAIGGEYQCKEIKDRNGNFITVTYNGFGRIATVVDTLQRTINFFYNGDNSLELIRQTWTVNGQSVQHTWASFTYADKTIQTNFPGLTVVGPQNNAAIHVLSGVTLADSSFAFGYTSWGQVWKISNYAADASTLLNYRAYNLPGSDLTASSAQDNCPRFTERRDWASNWNRSGPAGLSGVPSGAEQEVITTYIAPAITSWTMPDGTTQSGTVAQVTQPDGVYNKIYFKGTAGTSGWRRGLPSLVETYGSTNPAQGAPIVRQRAAVTTWDQDNITISYPLNPRVTEKNVYDFNASQQIQNHARTSIFYETVDLGNGMSCRLPQDVKEYQANATSVLRRSHTVYNLAADYLSRRIIGLVETSTLYEVDPATSVETPMNKVGIAYDDYGSILGADTPVQHDHSSITARGNVTRVLRYDTTPGSSAYVTSTMFYNTAGSPVRTVDAAGHAVNISYGDQFYANGTTADAARPFSPASTLAYPTTITDADSYTSKVRYNYDFGASTWTQTPQPNTTQNLPGPTQKLAYDNLGRTIGVTNLVNGAYTRYEYSTNQNRVDTYSTIQAGQGEAHSFKIMDGHGRVLASASDHPGSTGGFSGQLVLYDNVGQAIKTSNPTETSASGIPEQWTAAGDDEAAGWLYTQQTYDWKGRPLLKTNTDGTTKEASYAGCGCAGGQMVTLTDEGTLVNGVPQRRQQKIYSDVLGRNWKTELLNWQGGTVYSTSVNTYNARDQVTRVRQDQGAGTYQDTIITYDGDGRLKTQHAPEQQVDPNNSSSTDHTTWDYNSDDTIQKVTDARGAAATYGYNARHLVTSITYTAPTVVSPGSSIPVPAPATFGYDAAGNRTSMTDGMGSMSYQYDQLSRLTSETRQFYDPAAPYLNAPYTLSYAYNLAGELASVTDPTGVAVNYGHDKMGRLSGVTGNSYGGVTQYASDMEYRAFGGLKSLTDGNSLTRTHTYNAREQLTTLRVGTALSADFEYHSDGQIRYAKDNTDALMDRAYNYDQVGRLSEGLSGSEARGVSVADGIYRQSYQYDAWSNLTGRPVNRFWSGGEAFGTGFVNNRETGSIYDAAGNVTRDAGSNRTHTYDAVGRQTRTSETSRSSSWAGGAGITFAVLESSSESISQSTSSNTQSGSPSPSPSPKGGDGPSPNAPQGGYYLTTVLTLAESYDGDGRSLKRVETKTQTTPFIVPDTTETVDYYLRSSVLGGRVITELNALGQKNKTKVYVGGEVEAEQVFNDGTPAVVWKYSNPVTGSSVEQTVYGLGKKEYDPFGLELGGSDPYLQHEEPDYASMGGSFYREGGNPFDSAGGYTLNGMPTDFGTISRLFQSGSAALCPNNNCGPRLSAQGWELWNSGRGWVPFGGTRKPPADPGIGKDGIVRVQTNEIGEGYWDSFRFFFAGPSSPQNPTATPTPDDCHRFADMVQDLANNAANTNRFLGEFARNFTAANDSSIREMERTQNMAPRNRFGDSGFKSDFQDGSNQVRHFAAGFIAGAQDPTSGIYALRRMNAREHPDINPLDQKDINLNRVSTQFGATYAGSGRGIEWIRSNLARAVRIAVCGDSP